YVYISAASVSFNEDDLNKLLQKSRTNNRVLGITGLLLYADGNFIQVLEGEPQNLEIVLSKIRRDHRHSKIIKLLSKEIETRNFPDWDMGYRRLSARSLTSMPDLSSVLAYEDVPSQMLANVSRQIWLLLLSFTRTTDRNYTIRSATPLDALQSLPIFAV
ncbi:MAG: BLUF domain-containing protein, partial [Chloroflexota bacterium]